MAETRIKIQLDGEHVKGWRARFNIFGGSIATFDLNGVTDFQQFGFTDASNATKIEANTHFGAASLSKPVFAYLILKLIQQGLFSKPGDPPESGLDRPLCELADFGPPEFRDHPYYKKITPRMVLSHTTGLHAFADGPLQQKFEPGTEFFYSGVPFTFLQEVVEKSTHKDLQTLAKEYVFDIIGMNNSTFVPPSPFKVNAANSLFTTAEDYASFVSYVLNDEALTFAFENKNSLPDQWAIGQNFLSKKIAWGLIFGLQKNEQGEVTAAFHSGDMNDWHAFVAIDLKNKTGIVYFANSKNGLMLADEIILPHVALDEGLNYIFAKYGFARKIEPNWQEKEKKRVCKIIAKYEMDKTDLLVKKLLDENTALCTLSIAHPVVSTVINDEFMKFKENKQMEANDFRIEVKQDKNGNIESLKLNIFNQNLYNQFIANLKAEKLLPVKETAQENIKAITPTFK